MSPCPSANPADYPERQNEAPSAVTGAETVDLAVHLPVLRPALFAYLSETDSYIRGYREVDEPRPEDLCCDFHRVGWELRRTQKVGLMERREAIVAALAAIGEKPWPWSE